ncbi:ATP-binding protein [Pedobacter fastidiosus]|uniref:histidine kinase n=1 Tax=Pedobacter fastidiosus TaxID=2765361 RepID=A0ABR7KQZ4_9SPHI|nr:ATP-binding protein [Pedobacter fastidiosus]MBC6110504.1 PAS domain-containing protein [Pedobacter fastidiosus]
MDNNNRRLNNDQLLQVLTLSKDATAIYTSENIVIEMANDAMINFWGKDRSIIGKTLEDAVPEFKGQPFVKMLRNVLLTGITDSGEAIPAETMINGNLRTSYYSYEYRAIKDDFGKPYCILHTASDVTEKVLGQKAIEFALLQKEALEREQSLNEELQEANSELENLNKILHLSKENLSQLNIELESRVARRTLELVNSEARIRNMLADAPVAIAVFSGRELRIESANKKILEAWGKTDNIIGKTLLEAVPELVDQDFNNILSQVYSSGEPYFGNEIKELIEKNGKIEEVYSNFIYQPLKDRERKINSIMLSANVITEQVKARKKVERAEEMLQFALEAGNIGTWRINTLTNELKSSPILKQIYGIDLVEDFNFEKILDLITEDCREKVSVDIKNAIESLGNCDISYTLKRPSDEQVVWVRSFGKMVKDEDGVINALSGVVMDITEQKQDEQRKNDFISMVSHELKTPITSISAYVQLLQAKSKNNSDDFASATLDKVQKQIRKMSTMISSFLNVSRLESGKIHLIKTDFDLEELLSEVVDECKLTDSVYKINFECCEAKIIHADRDKIGAVISNLMSNAIKYSEKGKTINVHSEIIDGLAHVSIEDEGIGIKEQHLDKLFDRYYRVNNQQTKTISGFGIGLYLSAEIVKRHNGKIWAESSFGEGSKFHFTIPLA